MSTPFRLPVEQVGLERSIQRAMDQFNRKPLKINVDDRSFTQPLGRITGAADEFTKSIEASNARVVAFGASVAVIESVKNAFSQLVVQTIKVEKALADINVVMGASSANLDKFGNSLFKIAKNTAQSFDSVAVAATEFARQGLSMEQTLKRTNDALILTRLTGMKAADSVKGLTAAINAFGDAGLTTANIMNKLAAVDMAFAVSSEDLIDGLSRASAVAQDAGMNIDQLVGAITAAQQITARGGAVIGNSFKTIFTRIQRPQTIEQLEMLGVAVKDMQGNVIPAIKILENLAKTYDTLSQSQQSNIAQLVGGMFQINTLKAAMRDLGKENSITARAIQISASATDEAIAKNEQLNKTLDALLTKTGLSLQKLSEQIGSITVGPGIEKILKAVDGLASGISDVLDGDSIGSTFANGFLKGLGNVISGPGAILILGLVGKLFVDVAKFAKTSISNFMGMTSEAQKQQAVQESILNLLRSNHEVVGSLIGQGQTKRQQEQVILDLIVKQTAAQREQLKLAQHLSKFAVNIGANEELVLPERGARRGASGYIPNFNAKQRERNGAVAGGYAPGSVKSMDMPSGQMVIYNTAEQVKKVPGFKDPFINPPLDSRAGRDHRQKSMEKYGFDPYASNGFVPNFAKLGSFKSLSSFSDHFRNTGEKVKLTGAHNYKEKWGYGHLSNDEFKNLLSEEQGGSLTGDRISKLNKKRAAKEAKTMNITGEGYASLIPQINKAPSTNKPFAGQFRHGSKNLRFKLSNLLIAGPRSPAGDSVTDPQENTLEDSVSQSIFQSSAQFSNAIKPAGTKGVNAPTIKKKLESTPGGKGAVGAAVGAAFEAAVAQAYGIDSAMSAERGRGDFDVNLNNTKKSPGSLDKVRKLFGIPSSISRMDFKSSASLPNLTSMAKKIFNDDRSKYLSQIGQTASSGFIPNFAKDHPLIDAIQREKDAGLPVSKIRVNQSDKLKNSSNPMGLAVTNTRDEPRGMADVPNFAGPRKLAGFDATPFKAANGSVQLIVNDFKRLSTFSAEMSADMKKFVSDYKGYAKQSKGVNKETVLAKLKAKGASEAQTKEALRQLGFSQKETAEAIKQVNSARTRSGQENLARPGLVGRIGERVGGAASRFRETGAGRRTQSFGRFMGGYAGFGLPVAGGLIDQGLTSAFGGDRVQMSKGERVASSAAGSITTGASSGAMLGGAIGSIIPGLGTAVGSAVGAAIGGTGGLISALGKASLSQEELARITQESTVAQTELGNTISQLDQIENLAGTISEEELAKKITEALMKQNQGLRNDEGQSFADAYQGASTKEEQTKVTEEFQRLAAMEAQLGKLVEALGKFRDSADKANPMIGKAKDVDAKAVNALSSILSAAGVTGEQAKELGGLKKGPRRAPKGETKEEKTARRSRQISGTNVAKILGINEDSDNFQVIADLVNEIKSDDGWDDLLKAVGKSAKSFNDLTEAGKEGAKLAVGTYSKFQTLKENINEAAVRSKIAFNFLKGDLKIAKEIDNLRLKYSSLNSSVAKRILMEESLLQNQAATSTTLNKQENLQDARNSLLTTGLDALKKAGVKNISSLEKFSKEMENISTDELTALLDNPQELAERFGLTGGELDKGRELNGVFSNIITTFKDRNKLLQNSLEIEKKQISAQMRIQELQEQEAQARSRLKLEVDNKVRELEALQFSEQMNLDRDIKGLERSKRYQPFSKVGSGQQELFDNQMQQEILQKEKEKNEQNQIRDAQIQGNQLFKDTSVQDALVSSNTKLISAIDELRDVMMRAGNKEAFSALDENNKLKSEGSSFSKEIENRQAKLDSLKKQKLDNSQRIEENKQVQITERKTQIGAGPPSRMGALSSSYGGYDPTPISKAAGTKIDTLTESNEKLDAKIENLTSEIAGFQVKSDLITGNKSILFPQQTQDVEAGKKGAQMYNLNKIFQDQNLAAQKNIDSGVTAEQLRESIKQGMLEAITKDNVDFQMAMDDPKNEDLADLSITDQINALSADGSFSALAEAANSIEASFHTMNQSAERTNFELEETEKDLKAHNEQIKISSDLFNKLTHETEKTANSIKDMQSMGNASGAASAQLSLQEQYASQGVEGQAAMRQGMARQGLAPMSNGQTFMAGVTTNMQSMEATDTRFYKTLGQELPKTFANNMSKALIDAGSGIKSWDDALQDVALGFLDTLNQAIQQRLSDQILGAVTTGIQSFGGPGFKLFSKGGVVRRSDGGEVSGGSGTKDDVPAMLNSGEYVVRKSAVNKYGKDFLSSINQGTVRQRSQGGIAGPADPTRELDEQSGEGGFLVSSLGQAGTFEAGSITGRDNLMSFANQAGTSGSRDVIESTGGVDDYGQAMPGGGVNIQLEDESDRLSGMGLISGQVADEVMTAKRQALDAVGAYDKNVAAIKKYKEQRRKAIKNAIKQALIGAALSFGMSQLQSAVQSTQVAKASNTAAINTEAGNIAANSPGAGMGPPGPSEIAAATPQAIQNLQTQGTLPQSFGSGDWYNKGGMANMTKANSRFAMNGIADPSAYIATTQGARGSTSFTKNFFSRGGNAANRSFAGSGFQVNSLGQASQRTGFFGGFKGAELSQAISAGSGSGGTNTVGNLLATQSTNWTNSAGGSMMGMSSAPSPMASSGGFAQTASTSQTGVINNSMNRLIDRKAVGGKVTQFGGTVEKKVPTLLTGGEFVINKESVKKHGLSFFNDINAQRLNKGGVVGKGSSLSTGGSVDTQSDLLQQILDTLITQGENTESTLSETQTLREKIESKTTNNVTTAEAGETSTNQNTILQSILEEIKNQPTNLSQEISNSVQNIINKNESSSTEINNSSTSSSNSSVRNSSNVSSVSNSNFVDQATIQNDLLSQILLALQSSPSSNGGGFATSSGGGSGGGAGNININVTVDAKGNANSSYEGEGSGDSGSSNGVNNSVNQKATNVAKEIEEAVIKILTNQQRLGGVLPNPSKK